MCMHYYEFKKRYDTPNFIEGTIRNSQNTNVRDKNRSVNKQINEQFGDVGLKTDRRDR